MQMKAGVSEKHVVIYCVGSCRDLQLQLKVEFGPVVAKVEH